MGFLLYDACDVLDPICMIGIGSITHEPELPLLSVFSSPMNGNLTLLFNEKCTSFPINPICAFLKPLQYLTAVMF